MDQHTRNRLYYLANREQILQKKKAQRDADREAHPERHQRKPRPKHKTSDIKAYKHQWYLANRERFLQKQKIAHQANPEKRRIKGRAYYLQHKEKWKIYAEHNKEQRRINHKSWRDKHKEIIKARKHQQYTIHKDKIRTKNKLWYQKNKQQHYTTNKKWVKLHRLLVNAYSRKWAKSNKDKVISYMRKREALKKGSQQAENISLIDIATRDNWRCHICKKKVTRQTWSLDHLIPLSKGGLHIKLNVALAHRSCNSRRGTGRSPAQLLLLS